MYELIQIVRKKSELSLKNLFFLMQKQVYIAFIAFS